MFLPPTMTLALRVARILREFARRRLDERPHQSFGKAHPLALDVGARPAFHMSSASGIVAEIDADLLQDGLGIGLDEGELLARSAAS